MARRFVELRCYLCRDQKMRLHFFAALTPFIAAVGKSAITKLFKIAYHGVCFYQGMP
jgi:hypothetical protein